MPIYHCKACHFSTHLKSNYQRHLNTKKHIESSKSHHFVTPKSSFCHQNDTISTEPNIAPFQCHYCQKEFKYRQGMYRHIKYSCKKNKDEDLKELARLLNEKDKKMEKIQVTMQKQIEKLTQKLQIQNVVHGDMNQTTNNQNNTIYNIQLLNHGETDYSHLTPQDYVQCIKKCNLCVKNLIERVHFNENKPENMNIYISNIKGNYAMIYKDDKWQIVNKKEHIDLMYDCNEVVLETWYDESKNQYPEIISSFERYLKNRDESKVINRVKEQILLMLYNNRKMISDVL
tara:strand:+ start:183 stop:1043 length:861 start_codon:yes stop_codon:yes gene_type:complete